MAKIPNISIRGIRQVIPSGFVLGRTKSGDGQPHLIPITDIHGTPGAPGAPGAPGTDGTNGVGVPVGGTTGQVLAKNSAADYDTGWATPSGGGGGREILTANRTYYVSTTGSDSADGLTVGTPFLTIQHAIDIAAGLDQSVYDITIQLADGTYNENVILKTALGAGHMYLAGNSTTPTNVVINSTSYLNANGVSVCVQTDGNPRWSISDFKITSSAGGAIVALRADNTLVSYSGVNFGTGFTTLIVAALAGSIQALGAWVVSGGGYAAIRTTQNGVFVTAVSCTVTGTPAFTGAFVVSGQGGVVYAAGSASYSGAATGKRYIANDLGFISSNGGGASFYPGNVAGTTATGGVYS